jgi:hypothetical protein
MNIEVFFEAENYLREIEFDISHPINNKKHLNHQACKKAFEKLKSKVTKARAQLEMQRYFDV